MTLHTETITLNQERNVTLSVLLQRLPDGKGGMKKRPAVLIIPGGAYGFCSDGEGEVVAYPYLQAGFHAFVLRYSVNVHRKWPNPLCDYEQAMELIRANAEAWNLCADKIAVIGFSAGGHLAGCAATVSKNRPNAAIIGYAALEQDIALACQPGTDIPGPVDCVDDNTCPCFLFASRDDAVVPIWNTVHFEEKLIEFGISFESHIYALGAHGYSTAEPSVAGKVPCRRQKDWVQESVEWLGDIFGQIHVDGLDEPICPRKINGNREPMLSIDCTVAYLRTQEAARTILQPVFAILESVFGASGQLMDMANVSRLRDVLAFIQQDARQQEALDAQLRQIENPDGKDFSGKVSSNQLDFLAWAK